MRSEAPGHGREWRALYLEAEETARRYPIRAIERVGEWSPEWVSDCMRRGRPVVLTGFAHGWPARTWRFADLRTRFGNVVLPTGNRLGEQIQSIEDGSCRTTGGMRLPESLRSEISIPFGAGCVGTGEPMLFLGAVGSVTPLHRDGGHGLNVHLLGRKHWTFFSADQADRLYPRSVDGAGYELSEVKLSAPDYERHPRFRDAQPLTVVVDPGEAMLVPSGWFHEVRLVDAALSIAFPLFGRRVQSPGGVPHTPPAHNGG